MLVARRAVEMSFDPERAFYNTFFLAETGKDILKEQDFGRRDNIEETVSCLFLREVSAGKFHTA